MPKYIKKNHYNKEVKNNKIWSTALRRQKSFYFERIIFYVYKTWETHHKRFYFTIELDKWKE